MKTSTLLKTGITGTAIAALCCFTPVLVILFGAVGLAAWVGYLDAVLMPALIFFVGLTVYAFLRKDKGACCETGSEKEQS
jgi:mercuric ion transport protein